MQPPTDAHGGVRPARRRRGGTLALLLGAGALLAALAIAAGLRDDGRGADQPAEGIRPALFDSAAAWADLRRQVAMGPRPAGSPAARRLARWARGELPRGRLERVPDGLVNVVGTLAGSSPAVVVAAHYDTKDMPGFVGANDGASGTAVVLELARALEGARRPAGAPELRFVLFDGEESPDDSEPFESSGLRGSRAYVRRHADEVGAMVLLDMVGDRDLSIPREGSSSLAVWTRLRAAAREAGTLGVFPDETGPTVLDDHTPFLRAGIPAIDVIDFDFPCWHETCDDLTAVSEASLDVVGETVARMLGRWREAAG